MTRRTGQISIDYLAGALIFFGALVLLVSNVMTTLPQFAESQDRDELELSAWSISELLLNEQGRWSAGASSGTDWHENTADADYIGLARDDGTLSSDKISALTRLDPERMTDLLDTEKQLSIEFRHVAPVDTHRTFQQGEAPSFITEPAYDSDAVDTVHYGAARLGDEPIHVLLVQEDHVGWYNVLHTSRDWDFTNVNAETRNLTGTVFIPLGADTYTARAGHTEISEGNMLILSRGLGQAGTTPPDTVENIASVERYAGLNDDEIVEVTLQVWQ